MTRLVENKRFADRPPLKEEVPLFVCAARIVIALVRLEQIDPQSQNAANNAFLMVLNGTLEEAIRMRDDLERELGRKGKRVLFAKLMETLGEAA